MKSAWRSLAVAAALLSALPAAAQSNYVVTSITQTYTPLTGATNVLPLMTNGGSWTLRDEGYILLPLGFSFPYYGGTYTDVGINSNGILIFGATDQAFCNYTNGSTLLCSGGGAIPSTSRTPHNVIAPWWSDHEGNVNGQIRYVKPNASEMVIEFFDWSNYGGSGDSFSFQVRLNASGMIQVHYGTSTGTFGGTAGFENATGTQGAALVPCAAPPNGFCSETDWPTNTLFTIGQPVQPDLIVETVNIANVVKSGSNLTLDVSPKFRNFGQNDANGFHWKAYLSTDKLLDPADQQIYDSQASGASALNCPGVNSSPNPTLTATAPAAATNVSNGNYYVLVEVDPANVVAEFSDTNNVGSTQNYFTSGIDLVATSISGPAQSGPGNPETVTASWFNQGTDAANTGAPPNGQGVEFQIILSADTTYDSNDFVVTSGFRQVGGGATFSNDPVSFNLPGNVPGGDYYWGLRIDPGNAVNNEASETNNVVFASQPAKIFQADLENLGVDLLDSVTQQPTRVGFIGGTGRIEVKLQNIGGANAQNFHLGVVISRDSNLSLLNDTLVHDEPVGTLNAGQSQTYSFNFPIPAVDKDGVPYTTGNYYIFAVADSYAQVTELSEANNSRAVVGSNGAVAAINLRTPAADYTLIEIDVPSTAAIGEVLPIHRVIKNVGNADGQQVTYRFYASANDIITTDDFALPIIGANGQLLDSMDVTLAQNEADTGTTFVRLPATMVAGAWYIGAVVDVAGVQAELDETNNAIGSETTVQVAPSSMAINNQQLPDAIIGSPYSFKLSLTGAGPQVTWTVDGPLPMGLTLSQAGVVEGTPTATGINTFTVYADSDGKSALARLVLRVLAPTGQLAISTVSLPPVVNSTSVDYFASLAAAGGTMPYVWSLQSGALPNGLALAPDGTLSGRPKSGVMVGETPLVVEVRDSVGNVAQAQLKLKVVEAGSLVIKTASVPDTMLGSEYFADFAAENAGGGTAVAKPLLWTVTGGRLPEGMALTTAQEELGLLQGKALEGGTFFFTVQVQDAKGRFDVADYVLEVHAPRLKLAALNPPSVIHPGDEVTFQISTGNGGSRYRIFSGALPPGLTLNENGTVSGTVEMENSVGNWNYVVEAETPASGESLGAFSLEVTPAPVRTGCSAAPGGSFGLMALLAPLAAFFARRRRVAHGLAAVAVAAVVAAPLAANAQGYTVIGPSPATYVPLSASTGTTPVNHAVSSFQGDTANIPFEFEYYGVKYTSVGVSMHGYLAFGSDSADGYNEGIPHSWSWSPNVIIAGWWDYLSKTTGGFVRSQTQGTAPSRVFVVEWANVCNTSSCSSTTPKFNFQIQLHEGSNKVRVLYGSGTSSSSASVGIMGGAGVGLAGLSCTTSSSGSCSSSSFPANSTLDYALPPDLQLAGVSSVDTAYGTVPFQIAATLANRGGLDAQAAQARFYLSTDAKLDVGTDVVLGDSNSTTVKVVGESVVNAIVTVAGGTTPGDYFLIAEADPQGLVSESKETNNVSAPVPLKIGPPTADLQISTVAGVNAATSGMTFPVSRIIQNGGNAATTQSAVITYFVSDNSVVTVSDTVVGTATLPALTEGQSDATNDMVTLPTTLKAGKYWIGLCVDYDANATQKGQITEISEVNNCATGNALVLNTGALAVLTTSVPMATQNSPFGLRLEATGGDGTYVWTKAGGELPPGVTLTQAGDLVGTPSAAGQYTFSVKVASAGADHTQSLTLDVQPRNLPLRIEDQQLPVAEFGRGYEVQLAAIGGKPPYVWSLKTGSALPEGLGLSTDGFIEGRAAEAKDDWQLFSVTVKDADGTLAEKDLQIRVVKPSSMHIATSRLSNAWLGKQYTQDLQAIGGIGPYTFGVVKFQQLAQTATEKPGAEETKIPDGFGIIVQKNGNQAQLRGMPTRAGLYALTLYVVDEGTGSEDITTLPLLVTYEKGLAITTTVLPDAFVGAPYSVRLAHNGGEGLAVQYAPACVYQASSGAGGFSYGCMAPDPTQQVPTGLTLAADGSITGVAQALPATAAPGAVIGADGSQVFSFLVQVSDANGRSDVRSLSIKVRPAPTTESSGGCSGTAMGPVALALFALAGLIRRRR